MAPSSAERSRSPIIDSRCRLSGGMRGSAMPASSASDARDAISASSTPPSSYRSCDRAAAPAAALPTPPPPPDAMASPTASSAAAGGMGKRASVWNVDEKSEPHLPMTSRRSSHSAESPGSSAAASPSCICANKRGAVWGRWRNGSRLLLIMFAAAHYDAIGVVCFLLVLLFPRIGGIKVIIHDARRRATQVPSIEAINGNRSAQLAVMLLRSLKATTTPLQRAAQLGQRWQSRRGKPRATPADSHSNKLDFPVLSSSTPPVRRYADDAWAARCSAG
eukprot:365926-Chlamydomonas_euryale.AAC.7